MTGYLTRGSSNGLGKLLSRLAQAVAEGPVTAPHSLGTHLGWAVRGIGYSEKIEVEASEALEVLEVGLASRAGPMVEGLNFMSWPRSQHGLVPPVFASLSGLISKRRGNPREVRRASDVRPGMLLLGCVSRDAVAQWLP
ncbi:hypothetical protein BHE74_00054759 [Ensete ventricosum]|nr:hypothetical protein BHE74_00054759 [Ensete ventricosum]